MGARGPDGGRGGQSVMVRLPQRRRLFSGGCGVTVPGGLAGLRPSNPGWARPLGSRRPRSPVMAPTTLTLGVYVCAGTLGLLPVLGDAD